MKVIPTAIPEVLIIEPKVFGGCFPIYADASVCMSETASFYK